MWWPALGRSGLDTCCALLCALAFLGACGAAPPVPSAPARELGPLLTLVPRGSSVVVVARPSELMATGATHRLVTAIFPVEQLERFAQRTGVDPRALVELVVIEHPEGRLVLARGPFDAPLAVREAGERMAPLESSVEEPWVRRAGLLGDRRIEVAALAPDVVAWMEGTPQLAAWLLATARRPAAERRDALHEVRDLLDAVEDASLLLVAPIPLELPMDTGVGLLLARERALAAALRPTADGTLRLELELRGEFPPGAQDNFRALARSLSETDLGAALGARDALPSLRIEADDVRVALAAELQPSALAAGLRALLVAEMRELLDTDTGPPDARAPPHEELPELGRGEAPPARPAATTAVGSAAQAPAPSPAARDARDK